jgi:hypothetical protein
VISALIVGAALPIAPIAANGQQEEPGPLPKPANGSGPAVYILDGRVVAIRRDPCLLGRTEVRVSTTRPTWLHTFLEARAATEPVWNKCRMATNKYRMSGNNCRMTRNKCRIMQGSLTRVMRG